MKDLWNSLPHNLRAAITGAAIMVVGAVAEWLIGILDATAGAPPV